MAKSAILQPVVDQLLRQTEATGRLTKDKHITGNVFQLIENEPALREQYNDICSLYANPGPVNAMIGKRVRQTWKNRTGEAVSAIGKTKLANTYRILH
jgi:hypothetical protein